MSFFISNKQYLAPTEARAQYEPLIFDGEGVHVERIDVAFGHPLYTAAADIYYIYTDKEQDCILPVVPDGCMAMILFGDEKHNLIDGYMCGVVDEIKKITIRPNIRYILIRFLPGMGYSLIKDKTGARSIVNRSVNLKKNIYGGEQILAVLERETDLQERIRLISKIIRIHLKDEDNKYLIKYCTERIFESQGNLRVHELADETGFTTRHIDKMFERCVGISPKLYAQTMRLQTSMNRIMEDKNEQLGDIAIDSGFFDHAHMNRMYKKLVHCSSGEFRKNCFSNSDYDHVDDYI